mmetsp:Transcript_46073/g.147156  ORF Transcript_46073/g.147156 Transcript_46073/m.147156 type:complete len:286 (+) Transcript_46073:488-1345(+)
MVLLSLRAAEDEATELLVGARGFDASPLSVLRSGRRLADCSLLDCWPRTRICLLGSLCPSAVLASNQGGRSVRGPGSSTCCNVALAALSSPAPSLLRPAWDRLLFGPRDFCQPSLPSGPASCGSATASLRVGSRLLDCSSAWRGAGAAPPWPGSSLLSSRRPSRQDAPEGLDLLALCPPLTPSLPSSPHRCSACMRSSRRPSPCEAPPRFSFHGGTRSPRSPRAAESSSSSDLVSELLGVRRFPASRLLLPSDLIWSLSFCNGAGICCFAPSMAATNATVCRMSK